MIPLKCQKSSVPTKKLSHFFAENACQVIISTLVLEEVHPEINLYHGTYAQYNHPHIS